MIEVDGLVKRFRAPFRGEIVAVQAIASNALRGFAVEDTVAINLRFAGGALGTFMLSDAAACPRFVGAFGADHKRNTPPRQGPPRPFAD